MENRKFGELIDGRIKYAPIPLRYGNRCILAPKDADYRALGYKDVVTTPPSDPAPEGYHWAATGWQEEDGKIVAVYALAPNPPPPPRKFSKLKLYAALTQAGLWDALDAWLKTLTIGGVNASTAFALAQDLSEDYPGWDDYIAAAKTALGVTDEQVAAILEAAEV